MRDIRPQRKGKGSPRTPTPEKQEKDLYEASRGEGYSVPKAPKKRSPMTGSSVPISNIHIHSDSDHSEEEKRPLFAKTDKTAKSLPSKTTPKKFGFFALKQRRSQARIGRGERKILLGVTFLVFVVAAIAAIIFLPSADIHLSVRTAPLLIDVPVSIAAEGGDVAGTFFFREVQLSGSEQVRNVTIVGEKATGQATIINRTSQEQPMREQSRLVTEDGVLFFMEKHAIVPPSGSVTVPIIAAEAGEEGNIEPQQLNFVALDESAQSVVFAEVSTSLSGGSGEEVRVVSEDDLVRVRQAVEEQAKQRAVAEIKAEMPEGWHVVEDSWDIEVSDFSTEPGVGDTSPEIAYSARVQATVMGYEDAALADFIKKAVENDLDDDTTLFPGELSSSIMIDNVNPEESSAEAVVRVTHTTLPDFSPDTLKEKLAGRSLQEATQYLEGLSGVSSVTIETWPFWVQSIPRVEGRVEIHLTPDDQP